jgi:hypothetical protein
LNVICEIDDGRNLFVVKVWLNEGDSDAVMTRRVGPTRLAIRTELV